MIEGPKWCGKTTTAEQVSKSVLSTDDPSTIDANRTLSEIDPDHQEEYEANEMAYADKIDTLIEEYAELEEKEEKPGCVLLHESFVYLAEEYGYPVMETLDVEKDSGFSAKEIKEMALQLSKNDIIELNFFKLLKESFFSERKMENY